MKNISDERLNVFTKFINHTSYLCTERRQLYTYPNTYPKKEVISWIIYDLLRIPKA
jgi:hypothetical protein